MLSRVANSLYWLSRYLERAENLARLVEVNRYDSLEDLQGDVWQPLLYTTSMENAYAASGEQDVGGFITFSKKNPDSIRQCVAQARENARMVRDQISEEIWRELNRFYLFIGSDSAARLWETQPDKFHRQTIEFCMLLSGLINATVLHDEGWHFMQIGKCLERADKTTRILDMLAFQGEPDRTKLASALKSCSAFNAFQAEHRGAITLNNAMNFLLFSPSFPRSVRFCLQELDQHLHSISCTAAGSFSNEAERLTGSTLAQLNFSNIGNVLDAGHHQYIDSLQQQFNKIGQQVFETYILLPLDIRSLSQNQNLHWQHQKQQQQ
jgi:uncharacterized alpha-E superfamily protein